MLQREKPHPIIAQSTQVSEALHRLGEAETGNE